jgi:hypothetical protein
MMKSNRLNIIVKFLKALALFVEMAHIHLAKIVGVHAAVMVVWLNG